MMHWIHYILIAFEAVGLVFFFDSFLEPKNRKVKWTLYPLIYAEILVAIILTSLVIPKYGDVAKTLIIIAALFIDCIGYYRAGKVAGIFFAGLNYILPFFVDCAAVSLFGMDETLQNHILWIGLRLIWILILFILRKKLKTIRKYLREDKIPWTRFAWLPLFSGIIGIYLYILFLSGAEPSQFHSLISVGLLSLNIVSLFFMQDLLLKEEKLHRSEIQIQKKENQLQIFHDMQSLYERQGKKLHDYKKQLVTVQGLLESGDTASAVKLTKELTKSIAVEMSEVNTGHQIVNAVLNQEYRIAKGKGIGMMFSIAEVDRISLSEEDIVVVLGNLLDNAIHECEKIVKSGKDAVIQVKMAYMDSEMIISVQNPLYRKVIIENNEVADKKIDGHGIGLVNVRETVEKYDGSFAISCDENEFTAVVII